MPGYELPPGDERDFLATARTPDKERARLKRINDEFARETIKLPKREMKHAYDDQASLKGRKFVPEKY